MANTNECVVLSGSTEMSYARLASLKGALKLEKAGLKTRGGALRPKIAAELGLKKTDSHDKFIETVQNKMNAMLAEREAAARNT
jgi:hypothetical protein